MPETQSVATNTSVNVTVYYADSSDRMVPKTDSLSLQSDLTDSGFASSDDTSVSLTPSVSTASGASAEATLNSTTAGTANLTAISAAAGLSGQATIRVTNETDAVYYPGGAAADYDTDGDGLIQLGELGTAATDYAQGDLSLSELGQIATAYAKS